MRPHVSAFILMLDGVYLNAFYGSWNAWKMRSHLSVIILVLEGLCLDAF